MTRLRRARDAERRQLKLVLAVAAFVAAAGAALMATWFIWPSGHLQARIAALGVGFALFPLAAGVAVLRHRLYDIDVVVDRTLVYAAVTVILAAAFAGTNLLIGTALGGGSAWPTAAATLLVAVAFRPLRARVQDGLDQRFHRARYTALRRMAGFLDDLRAGRAAPEAVEGVLRELCDDPRLALRFREPESGDYVDAHGLPAPPDDGCARIAIERDGQPIALVVHTPAGEDRVALLRRWWPRAGWRSRSRGCAWSCADAWPRSRPPARGSSPRPTTSAGGSSVTCTTGHSSGSCRSDSRCGTPSISSAGRPRRRAPRSTARWRDRRRDRRAPRARPRAAARRSWTPGSRRRCASWSAGPRCRSSSTRSAERFDRGLEAAAYFIACEGLTNAIKHAQATRIVLRAAHHEGKLVVSVADDGAGGAVPVPGSGLAGLADRVAAYGGTLHIDSRRAGTTLTAELPCGS